MSAKSSKSKKPAVLPPVDLAVCDSAAAMALPLPQALGETNYFDRLVGMLTKAWDWLRQRSREQQQAKHLSVCDMTHLGDKRFVAIIQADGQRFLIGGTSGSVSLLATLPEDPKSFKAILKRKTARKPRTRSKTPSKAEVSGE